MEQKNCIYQVNATRVIEGVLEIFDITIDGSEEFTPFNQTFLIDFSATNTKVDSLLRFNGNTYSLRFSDSITNGDIAPKIGFIPKRALVKLDVANSKAIIVDFNPNNFVSPSFTGTPTAPTGTTGVSSNQIATQENVLKNIYSNFVSPAFSGIPTAPTAPRGTSTTQLATTEFATNQDLGVGQTWQDMRSVRALNQTYTNTTGKPIEISVKVSGQQNANYYAHQLFVNSREVCFEQTRDGAGCTVAAIIPPGETYNVTSPLGALGFWRELR